jgi:hypothetical protein
VRPVLVRDFSTVARGGERKRAGVRVLGELDVYQLWPSVLRARPGRLGGPEVKAGGCMELNAAGPLRASRSSQQRPGQPIVVPCSACRRPAAALVNGGLRDGEQLICASCVCRWCATRSKRTRPPEV